MGTPGALSKEWTAAVNEGGTTEGRAFRPLRDERPFYFDNRGAAPEPPKARPPGIASHPRQKAKRNGGWNRK